MHGAEKDCTGLVDTRPGWAGEVGVEKWCGEHGPTLFFHLDIVSHGLHSTQQVLAQAAPREHVAQVELLLIPIYFCWYAESMHSTPPMSVISANWRLPRLVQLSIGRA